ncbi:MAG: ubiquitin family protein [Lachnospiraceae bacterium]|nr:ubiquitin family protein [Lachnospiraceae bacterium]
MIRFEVYALSWAKTYEIEAGENTKVSELLCFISGLCGETERGILLSLSGKGMLDESISLKEQGVLSGDKLMYISAGYRKGGKGEAVKRGICADEGAA